MGKFNFSDLITLAKSGWTPDEVNKTIDRIEALAANEADDIKEPAGADGSTDSDNSNIDPEGAEGSTDSNEESEKDAKIAQLEKELAEAQANNRGSNFQNETKTTDELVDDIFKDFFN